MGEAADTYSEHRKMMRTIILCLIIGVASFVIVLYLRLSSSWQTTFRSSYLVAIPIVFLSIFFATILVAVANRREMGRNVSGWFDVIALLAAEGVLAYLIFGGLITTSLVVLICCAFVVYLHFAQQE